MLYNVSINLYTFLVDKRGEYMNNKFILGVNMRKIIAILLSLLVMGTLFLGCGSSKKDDSQKNVEKSVSEIESKTLNNKDIEANQITPEGSVKLYFENLKEKNYEKMYELSQPTWRENNEEDTIKDWYNFKTLKNFEIESVTGSAQNLRKVKVKCTYIIQEKEEVQSLNVNAIKENGSWFVNPISALN